MRLVRRTITTVLMLVIVLALAAALCGAALAAPASYGTAPAAPAAQALLATTPGWSEVFTTPPRAGFLMDVDFVDVSYGWAVGFDAVFATTDGGATWAQHNVPQGTGQLWAVSFSDRLHGWAAGENVILSTANGGVTWTTQYTATGFTFTSLDCVDATHAWAAGEDTDPYDGDDSLIIVHTTNGSTWSEQAAGVTGYLNGLDFVDETHGWIMVGSFALMEGIVLATTDGGTTWVKQHLGVFTKPFDVCFLDRNDGWALGYESDLLFRTTDGGATWQSWKSGGLRCIYFTDFSHGFAANDGSTVKDTGLYRTEDSGHTWTLDLARPTSEINNGMDFGDATHGCAVGMQFVDWDPDTGVYTETWSILRYVGASSDTTAPTTTASGAVKGRWYKAAVTVSLSANDNAGGSGVDYTEYALDGAAWSAGSSIPIPAPANHSGDKLHTILYRSADKAGNLEAQKKLTFGIDTVKPTAKAPYAASARRGTTATLKYKVVDPLPNGGTAKVTIKVWNKAGKVVKTLKPVVKPVNTALTRKFTVPLTWKAGTYRFYVYATDKAGNVAPVVSNKLIVR